MRCLNATLYALFSKRRPGQVVKMLENKTAECCRIFMLGSPSRQFIFNALSRAALGIRLDCTIMHYKL